MTNEELKKKIVDILKEAMKPIEFGGDREHASEVHYPTEEEIADALIAAGIGDVSCLRKHRMIAEYSLAPDDGNPYIIPNVPLRVTQLYSGEEVEKMAKERKELKDELRSKFADVMSDIQTIVFPKTKTQVSGKQELYSYYIKQAEKELAEEEKDENI